MSIPQPKQALEGHCSAIHNETLYVLSPTGLQSLPLKENATWTEEPSGTSVTGAACVKALPKDGDSSRAALYVIGGTTDDSSFGGLQRYTFASKRWEALDTPVDVLAGRTNHSAAYLQDSESILVYAGSRQDMPSFLSSQTFVVHTSPPFDVDSFISTAPPANEPILQPWNSSHAVMTGGSWLSDGVFTFDTEMGWQRFGTNLSEPLEPGIRGTIVNGDDGSKVLETYDLTVSPNVVTQQVLMEAGGKVAPPGTTIPIGSSSSRKRKRDLTLENFPAYNSTGAPTVKRQDYAVAQDANGMAVASGGNEDQPVSLFSQTDNSWIDASKFFNGEQQSLMDPSTTSSGSSESASPTTSAAPAETTDSDNSGLTPHDKMLRTLGITLGTLCGIAAVFIFALLYFRMRKAKKRKQQGYIEENEKTDANNNNRMSFADRGASFMKEAGGSISNPTPPPNPFEQQQGAGSHNSWAIMGGRIANKRHTAHGQKGSFESTTHLVRDQNGDMEMLDIGDKKHEIDRKPVDSLAPPPQTYGMSAEDEKKALNNRSSGWSRYFATSAPEGVSHLPSAYVKDRQSSVGSEWPSTGNNSSTVSRIPSSALVPPLNIDFTKTVDGQRLSNVVKGSPAFANSEEDLARRGSPVEGHKAMFEDMNRPLSNTDTVSSYDRSTMSTDYYNGLSSGGNTAWTPVSNNFKDHVTQDRPTSSLYTNSVYDPNQKDAYQHQRLPSRAARSQNSGFFPGSGTTVKPPKIKTSHAANGSSEWPTASGITKDSPLLKSPPVIAENPPAVPPLVHDRQSTATVFPHDNNGRWTANASNLQAPRAPALGREAAPANDRDSTATVFPHDNNGRWTAHEAKNPGLQLPRAPALANQAAPANDRDSTATVFPHDNNGRWTAHEAKDPSLQPPRPAFTSGARDTSTPPPTYTRESNATIFPHDNGNRWTTHAGQEPRVAAPQPPPVPPFPADIYPPPHQPGDRGSTATVFPHESGNRWTAHAAQSQGPLAPPRAPGLTNAPKPQQASTDRESTMTVFPTGEGDVWTANAANKDFQPPRAPGADARPVDVRDSTQTLFPRGVPSAYYAGRPKQLEDDRNKKPMDSDMSWLDLGQGSGRP